MELKVTVKKIFLKSFHHFWLGSHHSHYWLVAPDKFCRGVLMVIEACISRQYNLTVKKVTKYKAYMKWFSFRRNFSHSCISQRLEQVDQIILLEIH